MSYSASDRRLFFREFVRNFHTTGAILPSGRWLAGALARYVGQEDGPQRILEVGPGTGSVTGRIIAGMRPEDRIDLVELNDQFVEHLRERFRSDPRFMPVADRAQVLHCPVEQLTAEPTYDVIVSGLPLNNFSAALVEQILTSLTGLLKPGGTLSFFEYIGIRYARCIVSGREDRQRLRGITKALNAVLNGNEIRRDWVWPNVPPAWVHHVRLRR
jgi:phospholipid N-methyltransferase